MARLKSPLTLDSLHHQGRQEARLEEGVGVGVGVAGGIWHYCPLEATPNIASRCGSLKFSVFFFSHFFSFYIIFFPFWLVSK